MFITAGSGYGAAITAATSNATAIAMTLGPHWTKLPRSCARSAGTTSIGKDGGHEEDERVQQGENAQPRGGLADQVGRERGREPASRRVARIGAQESHVLVHAS